MRNLRQSLTITFFASNGATVVNFIVAIILARLLTPAEIGIFSIAYVLVSVAHVFRDFGVTTYLVREKDLTPEKIRSISGVLFATSWATAIILYAASGVAAAYYREPGVKRVVEVLALGFVFIPFGAITHSLLTRELKAREQAIASVLGVSVYAISSVALAWFGFSYMTMAWASLLNIIPDFVQTGMDVAAAFLPALGFAMLAQMIMNKTVAPFFFAGFFLVAYFGISTTGVAIFAAIIVVAMTVLGDKKKAEQPAVATEDPAIGSGFDEF